MTSLSLPWFNIDFSSKFNKIKTMPRAKFSNPAMKS